MFEIYEYAPTTLPRAGLLPTAADLIEGFEERPEMAIYHLAELASRGELGIQIIEELYQLITGLADDDLAERMFEAPWPGASLSVTAAYVLERALRLAEGCDPSSRWIA